MTVLDSRDPAPDADALARAADLGPDPAIASDATADDAPPDNETTEQREQREARRPPRPGRMERALAAAQRERDEARAYAQQQQTVLDQMHRQLAEAREAGNRVAADGFAQRIARAEDALRAAIHAGDADGVVKMQSLLGQLHARSAQIEVQQQQAPTQQQPQRQNQPAPQSYTATTQAWLDANPWYGRDGALTQLAKAVHAQAERAGHAVDSPEYWEFVENGIEAVAPGTVAASDDPDRVPVRSPTRPPPARAGTVVTRTAGQSAPRANAEIRLTADEADAARISGLTPQEYKTWQTKLRAAGRLTGGSR